MLMVMVMLILVAGCSQVQIWFLLSSISFWFDQLVTRMKYEVVVHTNLCYKKQARKLTFDSWDDTISLSFFSRRSQVALGEPGTTKRSDECPQTAWASDELIAGRIWFDLFWDWILISQTTRNESLVSRTTLPYVGHHYQQQESGFDSGIGSKL